MSRDVRHSDSSISLEDDLIVWRMSREVAEQLAMLVSDEASRSGDIGWREDSETLFAVTLIGDDRGR